MVPAGYEFLPGIGYYKTERTLMSWEDARLLYCESQGAMLIIPGSREKQKALFELCKLHLNKFPHMLAPWIGLKRTGGVWKTVQGWSVNGSDILWVPGKPEDRDDCGLLTIRGISADTCGTRKPFLCEIPLL